MTGCHLGRRGATRADVIVAMVITSMLFSGLLAAGKATDERARRTQCANNLRQIGQAIQLYANENRGAYPRTLFDAEHPEKVTAFTNPKSNNPFAEEGAPGPNDVTAALYLLLRTGDIEPEAFVCPSTDGVPLLFGPGEAEDGAGQGADAPGEYDPVDVDAARAAEAAEAAARAARKGKPAKPRKPAAALPQDLSNFPSPDGLTYSYTNPYPSQQAREAGFVLSSRIRGDFAVASDLNPGGAQVAKVTAKQMPPATQGSGPSTAPSAKPRVRKFTDAMKKSNSPNHGGFGQNVLYADGHVEFQPTPFCGSQRPVAGAPRDNIFTRQLTDNSSRPADGAKASAAPDEDPVVGPSMDAQDTVMLPVAAPGDEAETPGKQAR